MSKVSSIEQLSPRGKDKSAASLPPLYSVPTALARLQLYIDLPHNVQEAIEMFHQRYDHGIFLSLYRRFFPDEYAASRESEEIDPGWSYSPREVDFLYPVKDHLFPLDIDFMSEAGANGDRATEMIYLIPYEMPWWYEEFEHLSLGWQALRLLSGMVTEDEARKLIATVHQLSPTEKDELLEGSLVMAQTSSSLLGEICTYFVQQAPPFSGFGQVLALYLYQTGNPWLDTNSDNEILYEGICWCEKHVEEIAHAYHAAQMYEQQVNAFASWLGKDNSRISQLIKMIREALYPQTPDQEVAEYGGEQ